MKTPRSSSPAAASRTRTTMLSQSPTKRKPHARRIRGRAQSKLLIALHAGRALSLGNVGRSLEILDKAFRDWSDVERRELARAVIAFRKDRLINWKEHTDGSVTITLTDYGRTRALRHQFDAMELSTPKKWDKRWRFVLFDIPEKLRPARDTLRNKLEELGFKKVQQSLWAFPHACENEVDFIVEFLDLRPYVRFLETTALSHDEDLRLAFKLY